MGVPSMMGEPIHEGGRPLPPIHLLPLLTLRLMTPFFRIGLSTLLVVLLLANCRGQDDPFAADADLDADFAAAGTFDAPPAADPPEGADPDLLDPFTQQLLALAGRGNRQMADAIASLARTGHWPQVNQLLERLAKQELDTASLAAMQAQIEPAVFLEMRLNDRLSDNARSALDRLAIATKQYQQSPDRLRAAIDNLDDPSTDKRLAASRALIEGGDVAIAELVAAAVASQPIADRQAILRALLRLGPGGNAALRQLALYGANEVRAGAVQSLGLIGAPANRIDLITALHAADSSPEEIELASRYLRRTDAGLPSRGRAVAELLADLDRKQQAADQINNTDDLVTHWSVSPQRDGVQPIRTRAIYASYSDAADAAARLRRLGAVSAEILTKSLVADLGYRVLIDSDWGDPAQIESIRSAYGSALTMDSVNRALRYSIEIGDHTATVGLIRLIDSFAEQKLADSSWGDVLLHGTAPNPTPLVRAASSPEPRVRYEAALAVTRMADGAPYAGSSQVKRTLSEMTRLNDLPTAIIVETRPEIVSPIQQLITRLGYSGVTVQNVAQLQRSIDLGGDLRLIVSKTQLADLSPIEMLDVVRRTGRGNQVPIVFYGSPSGSNEISPNQQDLDFLGRDSARWPGPMVWIDTPATAAAFDGVFDQIAQSRRLPPLSVIDRQRFRREAESWIADRTSGL